MPERGPHNRRYPRVRTRCRVLLRDRFGTWEAETEDLGPNGCRIVTQRDQDVGALIGLTVESDALPEKLEVAGQVVWAVRDRPSRAGISFAGSASRPGSPGPARWFAALAAAKGAVEAVGGPGVPAGAFEPEAFEVPADEAPAGDPADLARRLSGRARELLGSGDAARAAVILRRALALAPGDAGVAAMLDEATAAARIALAGRR